MWRKLTCLFGYSETLWKCIPVRINNTDIQFLLPKASETKAISKEVSGGNTERLQWWPEGFQFNLGTGRMSEKVACSTHCHHWGALEQGSADDTACTVHVEYGIQVTTVLVLYAFCGCLLHFNWVTCFYVLFCCVHGSYSFLVNVPSMKNCVSLLVTAV